jgi:hypothetical protein
VENEHEHETEKPPVCEMCGGVCLEIGRLGSVEYFRCRGCGWGFGRWVETDTATDTATAGNGGAVCRVK